MSLSKNVRNIRTKAGSEPPACALNEVTGTRGASLGREMSPKSPRSRQTLALLSFVAAARQKRMRWQRAQQHGPTNPLARSAPLTADQRAN